MAALTRITSDWQAPFASRTIGFTLVVTDPDGGDTPFGGQLIYGGSHDDDGGWSLLRLRKTETVSAPYIDVSAEEVSFEARLRLDKERIRPFFMVDKAKQIAADSTSLQLQLADKYFQTYLNKRPLRFSRRALDQIGADEDVWDKVTSGVRQAFYFRDRLDEGMDRLAAIEPQVMPLKSRSALLHTLGQYWLGRGQQSKARRAFTQIAIWRASPWHVVQAKRQLWQMIQDRVLELYRL